MNFLTELFSAPKSTEKSTKKTEQIGLPRTKKGRRGIQIKSPQEVAIMRQSSSEDFICIPRRPFLVRGKPICSVFLVDFCVNFGAEKSSVKKFILSTLILQILLYRKSCTCLTVVA